MSWSLDWFAAEVIARAGGKIRRVAWTDHWLERRGFLYFTVLETDAHVVTAAEFGPDEFNARDWTDEAFDADPCKAVPTYNTAPLVYGQWTSAPIQLPPPVPGFPNS